MKAGASRDMLSQIECLPTRIPLKTGYVPSRWHSFVDIMVPKKAGYTHLGGLHTIVLFPVDCNFAFKHIGWSMMRVVEKNKSLACEQYGSRRKHRVIDLVVNKSLSYDLLCQLKHTGAVCSNNLAMI